MGWKKQEGAGIWLPEKDGDKLEGEVLAVNSEGLYGKQYLIRSGKDEMLTPSHKVLQARMTKVKEGDKVLIEYKGSEPPKIRGQNPTQMYDVSIWED